MKPVRVWFKKTGLAVYISHLDMNRCLQRAVIRAKLPLWYTEGFNPKPYLNFLNPLALGQEGVREPMDIRIEGDMPLAEVKNALSAVMPQGIEIVDVTEPVMKTAEITYADYDITLFFENAKQANDFCRQANEVFKSGELTAEKKSKRGTKTVNLCEMTEQFEINVQGNTAQIHTLLPTGSALSLNPDLLLTALQQKIGIFADTRAISRRGLYTAEKKVFA